MKNSAITRALERLAEARKGRLRPLDVVNAARPPSSPLHTHFEWNDTKAAQRYRLQQASELIRVVVKTVPEYAKAPVRVFVSLSSDRVRGQGYRTMVDVLSNAEMRATLLKDAKIEMLHFQKRYAQLEELTSVFAAMRRTLNGSA